MAKKKSKYEILAAEKTGKYTEEGISIRRNKVKELFLTRKLKGAAIARVLKIHVNTVYEDIRVIRDEVRKKTKDVDVYEEIGSAIASFEEIHRNAMIRFALAKSENFKNNYLNTAAKALTSKLQLMMQTGFLPTGGQRFKIDTDVIVKENSTGNEKVDKMLDNPASTRKLLSVLHKMSSIEDASKILIEVEDDKKETE